MLSNQAAATAVIRKPATVSIRLVTDRDFLVSKTITIYCCTFPGTLTPSQRAGRKNDSHCGVAQRSVSSITTGHLARFVHCRRLLL